MPSVLCALFECALSATDAVHEANWRGGLNRTESLISSESAELGLWPEYENKVNR